MSNPFANLDLANAPEDPFEPSMGTHLFKFVEFDTFPGKKTPTETYFRFKFLQDGSKSQNWRPMVGDPATLADSDRVQRSLSDLKRLFRGIGIPQSDLNAVYQAVHQGDYSTLEGLYGTQVYITLVKSGDYVNVRKIVPESDVPDAVAGRASVNPVTQAPDLSSLAEFAKGGEL